MKNLLNNLLNWVLKKGSSETKKEQAGSKKEQAEQKGNKLGEKGTSLEMNPCVRGSEVREVMGSEAVSANHALITQLSRTNHPISLRAIRYAAVLFMVFMVGIGNVWGDTSYYLQGISGSSGTSSLTSDFYTTAPCNQAVSVSYGGVSYSKAVKFGGNLSWPAGSSGFSYPDRMIRYDCKTTSTEFTIVAYANSNSKHMSIGDIKQAALGSANTVSSATTVTLNNGSITTQTYTINSSTRASLYVSVDANSNAFIVQIIATEKGTAHPTPGNIGYIANFNKTRLVVRSGNETQLDNNTFLFKPNESQDAGNKAYFKMQTKGTHYIKFTTGAYPSKVTVNVSSSSTYYIGTSSSATTNSATASQTVELAKSTTYYINPNGSNVQVTGIKFEAIPYSVSHSLTNVTKKSGSTGAGAAQSGSNYDAVFAAADGYDLPDDITVTIGGAAATAGTDYTWNSSTGAFQVPAAKVNGAIVVTIAGEAAAAGTTWYVKGGWNSWGTTDNLTGSGTELSATVNITTAGLYEFKIHNTDGDAWYGNGGNIGCNVSGWTFSTGESANCKFFASETGNYTFTFNTSTKALSVTYPTAQGKYYYKNTGSWSNVAIYRYVGDKNNGWPGSIVVETEEICGDTYFVTYADPGTTLIFNNNNNGSQTGNMAASGNAGKYVAGTGSSWSNFPTYTISYAANGGGSSMSNQTNIACGTDKTTTSNAFTAPDGYQFAGWKANVDVTIGGSTKTAGTVLDNGVTIQNISSNITLTAQWELIPTYDVIYNTNGGTGGSTASQTGNLSGAQVTTSANGFTKTGYKFKWWNTAADGSGEDFYPGEKVTIASADVNLYAQWEQVSDGWEFWCGSPNAFTTSQAVVGDMVLTSYGAKTTINTGLTADPTIVSKYNSTVDKHAICIAVADNDQYVQVHFSDGSPINSLKLWATTNQTSSKKLVVIYSTTADFSSGQYEAKEVSVPANNAASKALTDFSPATADKYFYARIYRKVETAVYEFTGGSGNTARIYGVKAQKGANCTAPSALTAATPTAKGITLSVTDANNVNNYEFYVSTSSTAPEAGATATHSVSSAKSLTITNLVAGTTYYAWARSVCGVSNKSGWTALGGGGTFTTSTVTMTPTLTNVTKNSGAESGIGGSDYTAEFEADDEYSMPDPTVTIGGNAATSGTDYTWSVVGSVGTITIPANKINGNIAITLNSADAAPSSAVISGTYHYFPGDNISLTCTPSGNNGPTTYQWYKGGKSDEDNLIDGATSATYTKNSCAFADAGSYYCKVTCNETSIWAETNSAENYDVKILHLYVKTGRNGSDYGDVDFTKVDGSTATASISLGSNWDYGFNIADGCGHYYGNSGKMTEDNCTDWSMDVDGTDCLMRTTNGATYTFTVDYSNLEEPVVSISYPSANQAADKVIYFDNQTVQWSTLHYRIGRSDHTQATAMSTKVPGTNNLYSVTTAAYNNFSGWHIANNAGWTGSNSIYRTDTEGDEYEITYATAHEGGAVTDAAITVTPTTSRGKGSDEGINDNCTFYNYTITNGMKTDRVTISDYSNGTITVNYVDTDEEAASFTSGYADLAHTVILTSITAVADEGYDASAITINGGAYSANYVVTGNTTIAASFTLKTYTISYNKGTNGTGSKASETKTHGVNFTLPGSTFTYGGHAQDGWSTSDGGALAYALSGSYTTNAAQEFFPHWKCNTPEISCSSNTITISVPTGATVYYTTTTDGSDPADPTSSSTAYNPSSKPTISADTKIKAIAIQSGCTNSAIASASLTYVAPGPSYTAPTSALDISAQTSLTAAGLITANYATQSNYLSTNTDTLLLIPSDIFYNIANNKKITWAKTDGSPSPTSADWSCPNGSVSFKGRTWWKSGGNINTLQVRSDRTLNIRVKGCKTVSVLNAAASSTKYFVMEAYEYDDGYKSSDPDVNASNTSTSVTETSLSLNSSKEYVVVLRGNTEDNNKVYEIKFIAPSSGYTVSIAANPAGYGTVSSSSVTSVASGTTLSASTNTLSVGATDVTASATSATAEYTYAFSNWTMSDGTALPSTVTADLSVYANFTRTANNYTLTWNTNGGSDGACTGSCTSGSTAYGASITAPNDPTLSNYTFDGWKTNNDGSGSAAAATMPAANTTYYAAWKQTVTLTTGAQGEGGNQTPYVYLNGTGVSSFTAHTASGYTLQGYYTAGSGGTKVLNADGTFAGTAVTDYITSSKWSRTGAAPTLYAQWVASEDCSTSDFVIRKGDATEYQGCMESSSYNGTATSFTAGSPTTVGKAKMTISNYSDGGIKRPGSGNTFSIVIEPVSGYYLKSVCWAGKVESGETVSYYWDDASGSATTISAQTTSGTGVTYNAPSSTTKFTASYVDDGVDGGGIWWRNVQVEVCAGGGTTYNVTYNGNDETGGTAPTDASSPYAYGATVTVLGNTGSLEKTSYTFAGWTTNNDGTGSSYVADNTFSITGNTTLYAKWTQAVTLDKNGGSTDGSATAVWNATGLTGITHAKPAAGYKLLGYYSASSDGTKVLNSDGSFAATNVTGYITSGKWSRTSATTLYAEYESAGALTWNLIVNSDTTNLSTSTKTSAFTEISTSNMSNATLAGDLTYEKAKKSALTGKISTPASYDADDYVYVTFQVASGYKFTPSSVKVKAQPVTSAKSVKLVLEDENSHSINFTTASTISGGSTQTVEMTNGSSVYFEGTVTLKIYCYGATDKYRLGTPITIEGEIEAACGTMPSYTSMSYTTTTFAPGDDASGSPITIVGGENIDTYQWKYNKVNDRTSGTNCGTGTSLTPLTDGGAATDVTRYYWCEMTNDACGITIKSPAVAITVAAAKSDATVAWTDPASTPNYGGGGYTIKATVDQTGWDGNAADLVITAPAGIRIYNVSSGTDGSSRKYVQADFDVQTSFDRSTYASNIPFTVSAAATASYNAISNDHNVSYSACTGAGEGSSYNIRMRKTITKDGNYYHCANTDGWISPNISSSYSTGKAGTTMATYFDTVASSNTQYVWVRSYHANVNKVRIYADFRANDMTVSNVYKHTAYFSADSKYAVDYTAVYNGDEENENTGTAAQGYVDITLDEVMAANDILLVKFNDSKVRPLGAAITEGSAGSLNTHLQWSNSLADKATVNKYTTDAYFTYSASKITENTNTLGAITYSSSNPSVATVDATGKVALIAAGSTTIKATLAASGCYKKAEISYTLNVTEVPCAITAGTLTLTSGTESKCSGDNVTLTLTGFESGASIQWKDGDTDINNGGNYTIATDGTTSTLTTDQEGTYSVMVTKDCSVRSNRITISNKSTEVSAKRIVKNWYIKNGRQTPDIELWTLQNGAHLRSVAWSPDNATGLTASDFYESDGKVYLKGKEPSSNTSGADINYTLTLTVEDDCGSTTAMSALGQLIYLHHQKNTDKHVLAFVVTGKEKGGFTEGISAAQTTSVELYNTIAANFDVLATNVYSTDDEQALKEYYSQFDILCVTDYPNTGTKGVNKKSYVDALGALVDIRPILTMEAFVSKLANWKAKGISGTPSSPTTRQYTMLLQCKDHEVFSGTTLTKVGEGDETMYRVSMVCDTLEDYKTLDATYGSGTHAEKDGYNYGGKPALQGFTFTEEMLDNDLLPLGLIDDGAGNDLQVGIERQTKMEARLMVLGINSYAMERLTSDGQTVVVNALKYLMKKNSEDIADCSNTFVGGDDEEDESTRYDWNVDSHWSGNAIPERTQKVRIVAPCVIKANQKFHVTGVVIAPSGKYNHGANTANGSLTIAAGGALIVDGKVEAATAPYFTETRATSAGDLTIKANDEAQGALILDNEDGKTNATVEMYSASHWEVVEGKKKKYWSYVALPVQSGNVGEYFYNGFSYLYDETEGWIKKGMYAELHAFEGLGISMQTGNMEYFHGALAPTTTQEITLTKTDGKGEGENLIGNSWTAPIQIANFDASDFGSATATVCVYNTGRDEQASGSQGSSSYGGTGSETAGQWVSVPIATAKEGGYTGLKVIPAMNAFQVTTSSETTLTLDYDKLVRGGATSAAVGDLTVPLRAPKRSPEKAQNGIEAMMCVRMSGEKTHADVWLQQDERFSNEFDNGWEATYVECDNRSPQFYAQSEIGKMAFLALPDLEGTVLGLAPSRDGNEYSFTFHYVGEEEFYLNDLKLHDAVLINEENSYEFTYSEGDTNRFYISRTAINAPTVTTGVGNTRDGVKAQKILYNNKLYIIINGRVYSAEGALVK